MVAGAAAFPMPPGGDVSAASKPAWLVHHDNSAIAQSYVRAAAALAFVVLAVAVAGRCRSAAREPSRLPALALIGGVLSGALTLLAQTVGLAAALYARDHGAAGTTRALGALQDAFLDLSSLPAVLMFAAVGVVALRTGMLPRWLSAITLAGAPVALIDCLSYDGGPFQAVGLLGLLYFLAWALITGVRLYMTGAESTRNAIQPAFAD
jgi:hypothetical protein